VDGSRGASETGAATPARIVAALAVVCAFVLVAVLLFGGSDEGHKYKFMFETGGQLVPGNQVLIAGQPVGTINSIDLTDNSQAEVDVTLDRPLTEGSSVVIRTTSLSGVANRYVSLAMGPDNADELPEGATLSGTDTTSPVDLDQLFNIFRKKERESLQKFISGNATIYAGKGKLANRAYKFLNPAFSTSERLFDELSKDSLALQRFLVSGAKTFGAVAERRDDLSALVANGNTALQAIEDENEALARTLDAAPDALRQANTTFVNLRATLDDLDPLVAASYPATENLAPFLRNFETLATDGRPVFRDLADVVDLPGKNNDLAEALQLLPRVERSGSTAFPASVRAMNVSQDNFAFIRPYTPDLFGLISKLGETTSYFDANGHYARVTPAAANVFDYDNVTNTLNPIYNDPAQQYDPLEFGIFRRCPGGGTEVAPDGSNPFLDDGNLTIADCDPSDTFPGP
jgi:phospholipid/cholesterol/gamma-HCH transport system substrate-binding protein